MNRLADETSPYLRQHADNPVDWYPWGQAAFAAAREADRPILLSVGYSSCHWCHVMAHESFEDEEVAGLMNELFVNVKVDREERPDVDALYMDAVQATTGRGGWPMTVFLTPEGQPFLAGTYFPREPRGGMVSFPQLCSRVDELWRDRRADLLTHAQELTDALGQTARLTAHDELPGSELLASARRTLRSQHDERHGGFGSAPKFPQAMSLEVLARDLARTGGASSDSHGDSDGARAEARAVLERSLDHMASGGIYDHIGGGFSRYSVDAAWLVPHFEKMLYDQALLARIYLHAWQVTGHSRYRQVLDETIGYVLRDLRHPAGGFYSAEDADSEGEEGRFYLWDAEEVREVLAGDETADDDQADRPDDTGQASDDLAEQVIAYYGIVPGGNFETTGRSIPNRLHAVGEIERPEAIETARKALFAAREERVRPGLDDKVLTEWNGLMLAVLAEAAAATGRADWLDAAVANAELLVDQLRRDDGRWLRSWQAVGGARHLAVAGDYAALLDAFVHLAEATGQRRWLDEARSVADGMLELFWEPAHGGLLTTGRDGEQLIAANKDLMDNALPSANSLAAVGLLRLAALTGEVSYRERAEGILRLVGRLAGEHPTAFGHLLLAIELSVDGVDEVVIPGAAGELVAAVQGRFTPDAVLAWGEPFDSPLWEGREPGKAYVCRDFTCQLPVSSREALLAQLGSD